MFEHAYSIIIELAGVAKCHGKDVDGLNYIGQSPQWIMEMEI